MGYFHASKQTAAFTDVFQHYASDTAGLKSIILSVIDRSIYRSDQSSYPHMEDNSIKVDSAQYARLKECIDQHLYYGSFNLTKTRTLGQEISWKWTEVTGKYIGCQFWSVKAKTSFDREIKARYGDNPTFDKAWNLAEELGKANHGPMALNHEHVFPIKQLRKILVNPKSCQQLAGTIEDLSEFFESDVVGCVLLKSEHEEVHSRSGDEGNSWLRYKDSSIKLVPNPNWSEAHREKIIHAILLQPPGDATC